MNARAGLRPRLRLPSFGRGEEFIHVSTFLDAIRLGPRSLLLEGEAGMGKTTIWTWALERAGATLQKS
jgi:hypothetical protein